MLAAMLIAALVMVLVSTYITSGGYARSYYEGSLTHNFSNAPAYVLRAISEYFNYPIGISATSYWGLYGWIDTPLTFEPPFVAAFLHLGLRVGTWLALLSVVWLVIRNGFRLARVARRRGGVSALRVATGDPLINAYLVFALIMIALYALSANIFGAQGRNWFPFVGAALATAFVYAPKVLPRGAPRRVAARIAVGFLACYIVFGSWSAIRSVEDRYYAVKTAPYVPMSLDRYDERPFRGTGVIDAIVVATAGARYRQLTISGWIVDPQHAPPAAVIVSYGGRALSDATVGLDRLDIPARIRDVRYPGIGFDAHVRVARSAWNGIGPLALTIVTPDGLYAERFPFIARVAAAR